MWAEYYVNLRLCTDTNTRGTWQKGNLAEAVGQRNSLFLLTDAAKNPGHISNNNSFKKGTGLTSFDLKHENISAGNVKRYELALFKCGSNARNKTQNKSESCD